ncbi:MAG: hypothetical protein IPG79_13025 [Saprospiraceae bacterium]|nr:hypothetical protein [Saprospiraceae bacterium]
MFFTPIPEGRVFIPREKSFSKSLMSKRRASVKMKKNLEIETKNSTLIFVSEKYNGKNVVT